MNFFDHEFPDSADLTFDQEGNMYGATPSGGGGICGEYGCGTVYELSPVGGGWEGGEIYDRFDSGTDQEPAAGVEPDNAGDLYGLDYGGTSHCGAVFEVHPTNGQWSKNTIFDFDCVSSGANPTGTPFFDASGNLYGATAGDLSGYPGTVFELTPAGGRWNFNLLYSFSPHTQGPFYSLTRDAAGNIYGTTPGGAYGFGNVFKLTPNNGTWVYTSLYDFTGGQDGDYPSSKIVVDAQGNLYGSTLAGGTQNAGVVFKITP